MRQCQERFEYRHRGDTAPRTAVIHPRSGADPRAIIAASYLYSATPDIDAAAEFAIVLRQCQEKFERRHHRGDFADFAGDGMLEHPRHRARTLTPPSSPPPPPHIAVQQDKAASAAEPRVVKQSEIPEEEYAILKSLSAAFLHDLGITLLDG